MVFLLKFQYQSYLGTLIFGLYVMACKMHFWLTWLDSLCWGRIEVWAKYLDMILIHKVLGCPYDLIWSPQSHKWGSTRPPNIFHVLLPHTVVYSNETQKDHTVKLNKIFFPTYLVKKHLNSIFIESNLHFIKNHLLRNWFSTLRFWEF